MFGRGVAVANIFGLIGMDMKFRLKQQLFRKTKGNSLVNFSDVKEPLWDSDGNNIQKSVFMVFFMEGEKMRETVDEKLHKTSYKTSWPIRIVKQYGVKNV